MDPVRDMRRAYRGDVERQATAEKVKGTEPSPEEYAIPQRY